VEFEAAVDEVATTTRSANSIGLPTTFAWVIAMGPVCPRCWSISPSGLAAPACQLPRAHHSSSGPDDVPALMFFVLPLLVLVMFLVFTRSWGRWAGYERTSQH